MQSEFSYNMQLKGIEQSQIDKREEAREKGKSDRISQANTQQSKLIEQRKRNLPPIKFESTEDTLDGFDLAEFGPKQIVMFDDFNITKYKHKKFPADFSLKTLGEIKQLQSTPINSFYANKYDNINNVFKKIFENRKRIYPEPLVQELISKSKPIIVKLKNYHSRKGH